MSRNSITDMFLLWTFLVFVAMLIALLFDSGLAYILQYFVLALVGISGASWLLEKL